MTDKKPTRVSSCTQEHVDKGIAYISGGYVEQGEVVPTPGGLAVWLDVCRKTTYNWAEQESNPFKEDFDYIMDRIQAIQGMKVISGGLDGTFHPGFAGKLVGNHGFSDKSSIDHTSSDGSMSPSGRTLEDFYADEDVST